MTIRWEGLGGACCHGAGSGRVAAIGEVRGTGEMGSACRRAKEWLRGERGDGGESALENSGEGLRRGEARDELPLFDKGMRWRGEETRAGAEGGGGK